MTLYQTFKEASVVFCALQNTRHHAVADEFPDRGRSLRRDPAGYAICILWPQASDCLDRGACNMRVFAARKLAALSPGTAVSAMGCRARRARWYRCPRRIDRPRSFGRPWRRGRQRLGGPPDRNGGTCPSLSECAHHLFRRKRKFDIRRRKGGRLRRRGIRKSRGFQSATDNGAALAKHARERRILEGARGAEKRRAMAAGDVGLPYAAIGWRVSKGRICGGAVS